MSFASWRGTRDEFNSAIDAVEAKLRDHAHRAFLRHADADGIYMLGSGWRVLDILEPLEQAPLEGS